MMAALKWLAEVWGSAGVAIIIFTIIVRAILLPLSLYQSRSQKAMMALQPDLKAIQQKYKNDRERLTQETMRMYREHGVNPMSGCLPLLLQLPILYGLYFALFNLGTDPAAEGSRGIQAFQEPFLWMPSLAHPDLIRLPGIEGFALPGVLPIVMAATQYLYSKMMQMPSADPQMASMNQMMTYMMPVMMLYFGYTFPSGLVLYWTVSNVFSIVQQGFITGWGPLTPWRKAAATEAPASRLVASRPESDSVSNGAAQTEPGSRTVRSHKAKGKKRGKR
jgi:YidC/Oxa1 family membrane protein insertase